MQNKPIKSLLLIAILSTTVTPSILSNDSTTSSKSNFSYSQWANENKAFITLAAILAPSAWDYFNKKTVMERYNLEELKAGKNILQNLMYLYRDFIWGTPPKNESIKLKSDNGEFIYEPSPKQSGSGIIGTIHSNNRNILAISAWVSALYVALNPNLFLNNDTLNALYSLMKDPSHALKLISAALKELKPKSS
jgi:hypothetical protein